MPGSEKVIANLRDWEQQTKAALFALAQHYAAKGEKEMKEEAPWTDRTGNARQELFGEVSAEPDKLRVRLAHQVDYGVYLELCNNGRFAVLEPVAKRNAPEFIRDVQELVR